MAVAGEAEEGLDFGVGHDAVVCAIEDLCDVVWVVAEC